MFVEQSIYRFPWEEAKKQMHRFITTPFKLLFFPHVI